MILAKVEKGEMVIDGKMAQLLDELGVPEQDRQEFVINLDKAARALTQNPQQELKWRLNAQLRGDDPGQPVNWRGLQ